MKKIVSNDDLRNKMKEAINLLCDTVKMTLGPKGNNIIIDHSLFTPFITNDGVTIAKNIESEDEVINTILELAKESTIKTDEEVGDGTTTTLVLLQGLFNEGLKYIMNGGSPIILKKELDMVCEKIVKLISRKSRKPTKEELINIARVSANDDVIGDIVYEVFSKVKNKSFISLIEGTDNTYVNYIKGYVMDTMLGSDYFLAEKEIIYENPLVLLSNDLLYDLNSISEILNHIKENNRSLVIISKDYDDNFINEILSLVINDGYRIVLLKLPEYGKRQMDIFNDILCISKAKVNCGIYNVQSLGTVRKIIMNKDKVNIFFESNDLVKEQIKKLSNNILNNNDSYDNDFYKLRLAMLKNKTAEIIVGAPTRVERREKIMRFEDAVSSLSSTSLGILPGGGIIFYEISSKLSNENVEGIFKYALKMPFNQILINSGLNPDEVIKKITDSNFNFVYNINSGYESIKDTSIIDSTSVIINSLINATSTAGMLLSTSSLVINEVKDNKPNYDSL